MQEGQQIREYTLKRKLGEGGMGEVWLATHGLLAQEVAVKFLDPMLARNTEVRERFLQEARIQASLAHPGIVRVLNAVEDQGVLALVMEYVDGLSLDRVIERRGPLPLDDAMRIMGQVLAAVAYAHAQGIVHRDLKPANIMVQANGTAKVMDFGIAKILGGAKLTRTGTTMGSAHYMAPEQVLGRKDIDHRADIYALGCTFYEMLTGRPPFGHLDSPDTDSDFAVRQAHVQSPVPDIRKTRTDVPENCANAIATSLSKAPDDRPGSCRDFLSMLGLDAYSRDVAPPGVPMQSLVEGELSPIREDPAPVAPVATGRTSLLPGYSVGIAVGIGAGLAKIGLLGVLGGGFMTALVNRQRKYGSGAISGFLIGLVSAIFVIVVEIVRVANHLDQKVSKLLMAWLLDEQISKEMVTMIFMSLGSMGGVGLIGGLLGTLISRKTGRAR